jgi:hypothetical protein
MSTTRGANDENKGKQRKEKKRKVTAGKKPTDLILYFLINSYIQKLIGKFHNSQFSCRQITMYDIRKLKHKKLKRSTGCNNTYRI